MKKNLSIIDQIGIGKPCSADWDSMIGNDRLRICEHCQLSVHNLSAMSFAQIEDLVTRSNGRLCVRYFQMPDGSPLIARRPSILFQLGRRSSRIAAGALTVAMAMSTAAGASAPDKTRTKLAQPDGRGKDQQKTSAANESSIRGFAVDANGAAIANASVTITSATGKKEIIVSGEAGDFQFRLLEVGIYTLELESPGFRTFRIKDMKLASGEDKNIKVVLQVAPVLMGILVCAVGEVIVPSDVKRIPPPRPKEMGFTHLMDAFANNNQDKVKEWLAGGENVNAQTSYGITALMRVGPQTTPELVKLMLLAGADLHLTDSNGKTALMYATRNGSSSVLQTLIEAGTNLDITDNDGNSAVIHAVLSKRPDNLQALLTAKANLAIKNREGFTALKYAREQNSTKIVRLLKASGAVE